MKSQRTLALLVNIIISIKTIVVAKIFNNSNSKTTPGAEIKMKMMNPSWLLVFRKDKTNPFLIYNKKAGILEIHDMRSQKLKM